MRFPYCEDVTALSGAVVVLTGVVVVAIRNGSDRALLDAEKTGTNREPHHVTGADFFDFNGHLHRPRHVERFAPALILAMGIMPGEGIDSPS